MALLDAARAAGVGRVLFVSSISAYDGCRSAYGRGKLRVETAVAALPQTHRAGDFPHRGRHP